MEPRKRIQSPVSKEISSSEIERVFLRKQAWRWFIGAVFSLSFVGGAYMIVKSIVTSFTYDAPIAAYAGVIIGAIGFASSLRYKVTLGRDFLKVRDIRIRHLRFVDVKSIRFEDGTFRLRTDRVSIRVGKEIEDHDEYMSEVTKKLRNIPNLEILGDEDMIVTYFPHRRIA